MEFKEKQKQEAIKRLQILEKHHGMLKQVVNDYKEEELIHYSETINSRFSGILYWVNNEELYAQKVKDIEDLYNIKVYHCILKHYTFGDILSMLYVSNDEECWEQEREDLKNGLPIVYAYNLDDEFLSEFGCSEIIGVNGGLNIK